MNKILFALAFVSGIAAADVPVYNCTSGCVIVSQLYLASEVQPKTCKLWRGSTLLLTSPSVPGQNAMDAGQTAPAGSVACTWAVTLPVGQWSYASTVISIDGFESGMGPTFTFKSSKGAPAAPIVRIKQ